MKQYEYCTATHPIENELKLTQSLNRLGEEGWELVSATHTPSHHSILRRTVVLFVFKREKQSRR